MKIQAVILVGGKGTRISGLYPDLPKALVPVAGKPFIERQVAWLFGQGITTIHLAAGHKADALQEWLGTYKPKHAKISLSAEPGPLGTAGGIKYVEPYIKSDPFFVLNGDSMIPNLRLGVMALQHRHFGLGVSIAVTRILKTGRYGTVEFNEQDIVQAFTEKSDRESGWVNAGVYLLDRSVLGNIASGTNLSIETDVFPDLVRNGNVAAYRTEPPLLDMGTPEGLAALEKFLTSDR